MGPWKARILVRMKSHDIRDEMQDGIELGPMPVGSDGMPIVGSKKVLPPYPRLCEAGPCRHYHRFEVQVDAANPRAVKLPVVLPPGTPGAAPLADGTLYQAPQAFHVETHHYCYPENGIELKLGSLPIITCNRWEPLSPGEWNRGPADHRSFAASPAGIEYQREVSEWEAARAHELAEAKEAEQLIADSLQRAGLSPEGDAQ